MRDVKIWDVYVIISINKILIEDTTMNHLPESSIYTTPTWSTKNCGTMEERSRCIFFPNNKSRHCTRIVAVIEALGASIFSFFSRITVCVTVSNAS